MAAPTLPYYPLTNQGTGNATLINADLDALRDALTDGTADLTVGSITPDSISMAGNIDMNSYRITELAHPTDIHDAVDYETLLNSAQLALNYFHAASNVMTTTYSATTGNTTETPVGSPETLSNIYYLSTVADTPTPITVKNGTEFVIHFYANVTATAGMKTVRLSAQLFYVDSDGVSNPVQIGADTSSSLLDLSTTMVLQELYGLVTTEITIPAGKRLRVQFIATCSGTSVNYPEINVQYGGTHNHLSFPVVGGILANFVQKSGDTMTGALTVPTLYVDHIAEKTAAHGIGLDHATVCASTLQATRLGVGVAPDAVASLKLNTVADLAGNFLTIAAGVVNYRTPAEALADMGGAPANHAILSATHNDTTAAAVVRGDIITGQGAVPTWTRLAITVPAATYMDYIGTANGDTEPAYKALFDAVVPTTIAESAVAATGAATVAARRDHTHGAPATWAATAHNLLSATHGDSTAAACILGDIIVGQAGPVWARYAISVPAANLMNVLGVVNGETVPTWKAIFDANNPTTIAVGDAAAPGTATIAAHRDHQHASPATWTPSAHTHDGDTLQNDGVNSNGGAFSFVTTGSLTHAMGANNGMYLTDIATDDTDKHSALRAPQWDSGAEPEGFTMMYAEST